MYKIVFMIATLMFFSCKNLFNPDGEASAEIENAHQFVLEGERLLREQRYLEAEIAFSRALEKDSSLSLAYTGLAKTVLRKNQISPLTITNFAQALQETKDDTSSSPLLAASNALENIKNSSPKFLPALSEMRGVLDVFFHRDSINKLYTVFLIDKQGQKKMNSDMKVQLALFNKNYTGDNALALKDSLAYCLNTEVVCIGREFQGRNFPLLDGDISADRLELERGLAAAVSLFDAVGDLVGILGDDLDVANIKDSKDFAAVLNDPQKSAALNEALDQISNDAGELTNLVTMINNQEKEPGDTTAQVSEDELQAAIDEAGGTIIFYKLADGIDNDGDGCADEEIYDEKDNDGDGIVDEDLRAGDFTNQSTLNDLLDNDKDGQIDEADELFEIDSIAQTSVVSFSVLESFRKGEMFTDEDFKLKVALDSNFKEVSLSERQEKIGGCW